MTNVQIVNITASEKDFGKVPDEMLDDLELIFYSDPINAASKAMNLE